MQTQHPKLQALLAFWNARRNGRPMPGRRDFRAEDLYPWMGNLALNDVQHDPLRIRARLVGTRIVEYEGTDYTVSSSTRPSLPDSAAPSSRPSRNAS